MLDPEDEDIKIARAVLDVLVAESVKAEGVLMKIATRLDDEGLALALAAQARALKHAADEASKLITHLGTLA